LNRLFSPFKNSAMLYCDVVTCENIKVSLYLCGLVESYGI